MSDEDLEARLRALEEAQARRHEQLLARLERPRTAGQAAADVRETMRAGYEQTARERREAAEGGDPS